MEKCLPMEKTLNRHTQRDREGFLGYRGSGTADKPTTRVRRQTATSCLYAVRSWYTFCKKGTIKEHDCSKHTKRQLAIFVFGVWRMRAFVSRLCLLKFCTAIELPREQD